MNEKLSINKILLIIVAIIFVFWILILITKKPPAKPIQTHTQQQPTSQQQHTITQQHTIPQQPSQNIVSDVDSNKPFTLYYFYNPNCPHCQTFNPAWKTVVNQLKNIKDLSIREINSLDKNPENENLSFYYNITGYPTIILVTPDKNMEYTGARKADDLYKYVIDNIREYGTK